MLSLVPMALAEANEYVRLHHRHNVPVRGCKFCVGVVSEAGGLRGVAIAGRPVARSLDNGRTLEILRVCTDGTANAPSMLYGACRRAGKALGYTRIVTYTMEDEGGASLRAAGFQLDAKTKGGSWSCPSRPRTDKASTRPKFRWLAS